MRHRVLALVGLVALAGGAHAQPVEDPDLAARRELAVRRAAAETVEQAAVASGAREDFDACGEAYLALADDPTARDQADELRYNAAICFTRGGSAGVALAAYDRLVRDAPAGPLAPRALAQAAALRFTLGDLAGAADRFEQLGARFPADPHAEDGLTRALAVRRALGDVKRATAIAQTIARVYGGTRPLLAAQTSLVLAAWAEERGATAEAVDGYQRYLKAWASKDEPARVVGAYAALAALRWRQACPVALASGLCAKPLALGALPRCASRAPLIAVARNRRLTIEAMTAARAARELYERRGLERDQPWARAAYARARLIEVEAQVEATLARSTMPAVHDTDPASMKTFASWLEAWRRDGEAAQRAIGEVIALRDGAGAIAAVAHATVMMDSMADVVASAPVPAVVFRAGTEATGAYCDAMGDVAEPIVRQAREAALTCVARAGDVGVADDATLRCVRVADRRDPDRAVGHERRAAPGVGLVVLDLAPPAR